MKKDAAADPHTPYLSRPMKDGQLPPVGLTELPPKEKPQNSTTATGETGGPQGAEPTRFGDWERKGRCSDF